jgi:hypothetical protein
MLFTQIVLIGHYCCQPSTTPTFLLLHSNDLSGVIYQIMMSIKGSIAAVQTCNPHWLLIVLQHPFQAMATSHYSTCVVDYHLLLTFPSPNGVPSHHSAVHVYPHQWMPQMQRLLVLQQHTWKACVVKQHWPLTWQEHPIGSNTRVSPCVVTHPLPVATRAKVAGPQPQHLFIQPNGTISQPVLLLLHMPCMLFTLMQWLRL